MFALHDLAFILFFDFGSRPGFTSNDFVTVQSRSIREIGLIDFNWQDTRRWEGSGGADYQWDGTSRFESLKAATFANLTSVSQAKMTKKREALCFGHNSDC